MTHAELRAQYKGPGLEPTSCPGELAAIEPDGRHHPWTTDHAIVDSDGRRVRIHRCKLCGHTIALDATDGRIRNDYPDPTGNRRP
jgi:hypothetical protein